MAVIPATRLPVSFACTLIIKMFKLFLKYCNVEIYLKSTLLNILDIVMR